MLKTEKDVMMLLVSLIPVIKYFVVVYLLLKLFMSTNTLRRLGVRDK